MEYHRRAASVSRTPEIVSSARPTVRLHAFAAANKMLVFLTNLKIYKSFFKSRRLMSRPADKK
jgi:hypothetical protein